MNSDEIAQVLIAIISLFVGIASVIATLYVFWKTKASSELDRRFDDTKGEVGRQFDDFSRRLTETKESNTREHQIVCDRLDDLKNEVVRLDEKVDEGLTRVHERMNEHLLFHAVNGAVSEVTPRRGRPRKTAS